jgi:Holliday junction resolvase RusA-like endonuclease
MMRLKILGKPIAKKRPRFARVGKFVRTYNPQETEEGRFLFEAYRQLGNGFKPIEKPITVIMGYYMPIPKGTSKKKKTLMVMKQIQHCKKPDLSNLVKFTEDALNNVVWKDDSQITMMWAHKQYSKEPRTEITIMGEDRDDDTR